MDRKGDFLRITLLIVALVVVALFVAQACGGDLSLAFRLALDKEQPTPAKAKQPWASPVEFPQGAVRYQSTSVTQEIAVTNGRDRISPVRRRLLDRKWQVPGGMEGVEGWRSETYKLVPGKVEVWIGDIAVKNSFGHFQNNRGLLRRYPNGTRFDDVLFNDKGEVFEHRMAEKKNGKWTRSVVYRNMDARPKGYSGLAQACASCHSEAGSGAYAAGLVPGGDEVLSDPLPWELVGYKPEQPERRWQAFADGDATQIMLMENGEQIGTYTFRDGKYWPLVNGKVSDVASEPPIAPPPEPLKAKPADRGDGGSREGGSQLPLSAVDCVGGT